MAVTHVRPRDTLTWWIGSCEETIYEDLAMNVLLLPRPALSLNPKP
jgi:hypothetical protein